MIGVVLERIALLILSLLTNDFSDSVLAVPEDAKLNFTQLAIKYGQVVEEHNVITEDGYILKLFHIPGDKTRPVFLISGNMGTADEYIVRGNTSLAVSLAEFNYDVWIGNKRGTKYSRNHVSLNPDVDAAFWDFSFHEYGIYDMAAFIDYILDKTKQKQVNVIGYSVGTSVFYVLGSERPEYNKKVRVMISLAPIAYLYNSVTLSAVNRLAPIYNQFLLATRQEEINGENSTNIRFIRRVCATPLSAYYICLRLGFFPLAGYDSEEIEATFAPVLFGHYPSSLSRKNLMHLSQVVNSKRFPKYDYGVDENLAKYGAESPPDYDLSSVTMKVVLISGKNDLLSTLADVELLKARLPNADHIILEPEKFNHLDFAWGRNTHKVLFPYIFELLNEKVKSVLCD